MKKPHGLNLLKALISTKIWGLIFLVLASGTATTRIVFAEQPISAESEFELLATEYDSKLKLFYQRSIDTIDAEQLHKLFQELHPANSMANQFFALEEKRRRTVVGLSCLHHVVSTAAVVAKAINYTDVPATSKQRALLILKDHYRDDPELDLVFPWVNVGPRCPETKVMLESATESKHRHVRCAAIYALCEALTIEAEVRQELDAQLIAVSTKLDQTKKEEVTSLLERRGIWKDVIGYESLIAASRVCGRLSRRQVPRRVGTAYDDVRTHFAARCSESVR